MIDQLSIKGVFHCKVIDVATGNVLEDYTDNNLVVNSGRTAVTRLLGGDVVNRSITQLAVGTNPAAPAATDSAPLTGEFKKALGTVTYPTISSVRYDWTLEDTEANGMGIREFGLQTAGNVLFARKTREVINKNSSIRLVGYWEITF